MTILINMSSYAVENADSMGAEYSEEVMYAGWNPDIALLACYQPSQLVADKVTSLPTHLLMEDAEQFLQNMYEYQS